MSFKPDPACRWHEAASKTIGTRIHAGALGPSARENGSKRHCRMTVRVTDSAINAVGEDTMTTSAMCPSGAIAALNSTVPVRHAAASSGGQRGAGVLIGLGRGSPSDGGVVVAASSNSGAKKAIMRGSVGEVRSGNFLNGVRFTS